MLKRALTFVGIVLCVGCGSQSRSDDDHTWRVLSDTGTFELVLLSENGGASVGLNTYRLLISETMGNPKSEITIEIEPWMPGHNHGSDRRPAITLAEHGEYTVDSVSYTMPGFWVLRTQIQANDFQDTAVFEVDVR